MKKFYTMLIALTLILGIVSPTGMTERSYFEKFETETKVSLSAFGDEEYGWWIDAWLEELGVNVEIIWSTYSREAYDMTLAIKLMTGDIPDVVCVDARALQGMATDALALPLDSALEFAYPVIRERVFEENIEAGVIDGVRYGLPLPGGERFIALRAGLENPRAAMEMINLYWAKTRDPELIDRAAENQACPIAWFFE